MNRQLDNVTTAPEKSTQTTATVELNDGWRAALAAHSSGASLYIHNEANGGSLEVSISLTAEGPVIRARAAALELESEGDLHVRCERFRLEARKSLELVTEGKAELTGRQVAIAATHGSARIVANDDVQLRAEQVLLNCDRPPAMPGWVLPSAAPLLPTATLPVVRASGDPAFIAQGLPQDKG